MPQVRCSSTLTYGKHHLPFPLRFVARSQTCSIILYENFCQAQKQPQLSTQERKSDAHSFFFSVFFCFHFRKCSHFLVFSVVSCGLQIESSMRLSLPGHKFGSASSFWSFALSHFIWNFFFLFGNHFCCCPALFRGCLARPRAH